MTRRVSVPGQARARATIGFAGVALAGVVLSGCAAPADPDWRPPAWPAAAVSSVAPPEPVPADAVAWADEQRIRTDDLALQARFSLLPGRSAFNDAIAATVREAIAGRVEATGIAYTPRAQAVGAGMSDRACIAGSTTRPAPEVLADPATGPAGGGGTAVVCDIVVSTGALWAQRIRTVSGDASAVTADSSTLRYVDLATGVTLTGGELWRDEAAGAVWPLAIETVRRDHGALSRSPAGAADEAAIAVIRAALADAVLQPGGVVVTVPAGLSSPELRGLGVEATTEPSVFFVPAPTAAPLLTDAGAALLAAASAAPVVPEPVLRGDDDVDCTLVPCVALTYDDGPSALTDGILDDAAEHEAALTFFALGSNVRRFAETARRVVAEGHLLENHSWSHPSLPKLTPEQVVGQIGDTNSAIADVTGIRPTAFRPPYGEYTAQTLDLAGMPAILWDVDTLDWQGPADAELVARAVERASAGSIVLQHDIHDNTARTADAVYAGLLDRGFTLVNLRQLFDGRLPASGAWRSAR